MFHVMDDTELLSSSRMFQAYSYQFLTATTHLVFEASLLKAFLLEVQVPHI